jgi:glycine/D-amino acid oxidase-like deaminating enzyme
LDAAQRHCRRHARNDDAKTAYLAGVESIICCGELPPVDYSWAGTFAETRDGLPFIGAAPNTDPRLLYALCFGGNGITFSALAGPMLRALIEGPTHPLQHVFGFERLDSSR